MTADGRIWVLVRVLLILSVVLAAVGMFTSRKRLSDTLVNLSILCGGAGFAMFLAAAATGGAS